MKPYRMTALQELVTTPITDNAFEEWIKQADVVEFLEGEIHDDQVAIYVSIGQVFLHAVLIPGINPKDQSSFQDLRDWSLSADASWGITVSRDDAYVSRPLDYSGSKVLETGEKLAFLRFFDAIDGGKGYIEMNQIMCHALGLHHMAERNAWCYLNSRGDLVEAIKVHSTPTPHEGRVVSVERGKLAEYAAATGQRLVRMFDIIRSKPTSGFFGYFDQGETREISSDGIVGTLSVHSGSGSYFRGFQVVDLGLTKAAIADSFFTVDRSHRRFESFIASDWRNHVTGEFSCDPRELVSYFEEREGPFEVTPAFFRPEVLSKYKADPEKYAIEGRTISCRSSWHLQSWGVNDVGQVFTYLCYLGQLPHEEQLHWKQFNEEPKAGLPEGVIKTDFRGEWDESYDPLQSLVSKCRNLRDERRTWWQLPDPSLLRRTLYPFTDTRADWSNELLNLDQLLVESFQSKRIRERASELKADVDDKMRALKLIEACLVADGFDTDRAREVMSPFHELHNLRSELKGHASGETAKSREMSARREDRTLMGHFRRLCKDCDESLAIISRVLGR